MNIRIALCDDNDKMLPVIAGATKSAFAAEGIDADISLFTSGEDLLTSLDHCRYQLILLDIEMPGMDGIDVGRQLRAMDDNTKIVFVSEAEARVFESFQVQPLGFVRKSNFLVDITAVAELYIRVCSKEETGSTLELSVRSGIVSVKTDAVRYIEGNGNYQLLYLEGKKEPVEVKMTMDKLEHITGPHGFIRVHKGFLVNYQYIHRVTSDEVILSDGASIPVGRSKTGEVKARFLSLVGK